jgi:hypothetical protein
VLTEVIPVFALVTPLDIVLSVACMLVSCDAIFESLAPTAASVAALAIPPFTVNEPVLASEKPLVVLVTEADTKYTPDAADAGRATVNA